MASPQPLYSRLYDVMAERIQSGEWPEGQRVPSEKVLVDEFGTSRGPVRQALSRLRAEGLIDGGRGAPPRVQPLVPAQSFDSYLSFTEWAEGLGRSASQRTIEVTRRLADERIAHALEVEPESPVVVVTRLRMLDDEPVMLERGTYTENAGRYLLEVDLETSSIYQTLRDHGIVPSRARNVIDAVAAGELEAHWLGVAVGSPLLRVRRVSYDQHGRVVDLAENQYLPSKATFAIENTKLSFRQLTRLSVDGDERPKA